MSSVALAAPLAYLLPLAMAALLALYVRRRRRAAAALGDAVLLRRLVGADLSRTPWPRLAAVLAAAGALAGAILASRTHAEVSEEEPAQGSVVLVLDASNSMLASDLLPSRLEAQRSLARTLVTRLPDRPFGIVVFAGRAYAVAPPTRDRGAIELYLGTIHPDIVSQTGSSIAAALRQGIGLLLATEEDARGGTVVLVTDGDETGPGGELEEALAVARRAGVVVHAIGAATPRGATVPSRDPETSAPGEPMRGPGGTPIVSRLGEGLLRSVAVRTGGLYAPLGDPAAVDAFLAHVEEMGGRSSGDTREGEATYVWLAALALVLLGVEAALARTRRSA